MDHQQWVTMGDLYLSLAEVLNTYWHFRCPVHGPQYEKPLQAVEKIGLIPVTAKCNVLGCRNKTIGALDGHAFCLSHFTVVCRTGLDTYNQQLSEQRWDKVSLKSLSEFVFACVQEEQRIERAGHGFDDVQRAQFLQIISAATDIASHLRRSPRRQLAILIRVQLESQVDPWEENTETMVVSRCGALVRCQHLVEHAAKLRILHFDSQQRAEAKVVWRMNEGSPSWSFAFEFIACANFWGLDWAAA
jgi:hypothetical protein